MARVSEVIEHLQQGYRPEQHIAAPIWCEDDVLIRARQRNMSITRVQARAIIDEIGSHHDCELGITWVTIDCALDELEK